MIKDIKYLKVVSDTESQELRPVLNRLKDKLLFCTCRDGRTFVSRLIAIHGRQLYFETRRGDVVINNIEDISTCSEYIAEDR